MPFQIITGDILTLSCDAVINPTDEFLSGSGGLDAQVHRAAGSDFSRMCRAIGHIDIGKAVITFSPRLLSLYVIHTVAPWWSGRREEIDRLRACYRSALQIAVDYRMQSLAFPLIGSGTRGFPKELVLQVASEELRAFLLDHADMDITLVVHDRRDFQPSRSLLDGLDQYLRVSLQAAERREAEEKTARAEDMQAVRREQERKAREADILSGASTASFPAVSPEEAREAWARRKDEIRPWEKIGSAAPVPAEQPEESPAGKPRRKRPFFSRPAESARREDEAPAPAFAPTEDFGHSMPVDATMPVYDYGPVGASMPAAPTAPAFFDPRGKTVLDESFSQMVLRKIDERGFKKDSECYARANIDKRLFSKIRGGGGYHPKKTTAVALAIALELSLEETQELLMKAGYSLSHSILFDLIVEYCITQHNYNIFEINELLFQYDQPLLGS